MNVYQSELIGDYCAGLAIIYAESVEEASVRLENYDTYIGIEGKEYDDDDDYRTSSYCWSKPALVEDLSTTETVSQIKLVKRYIE